jgi:hypothetical protein
VRSVQTFLRQLASCILHLPVGDDHHAIKNLGILLAALAGEPVRQPGNAAGLATVDGVLADKEFGNAALDVLARPIYETIPQKKNPKFQGCELDTRLGLLLL